MQQNGNLFINTGIINGSINQSYNSLDAVNPNASKEVLKPAYLYDVAVSYASEQENYVSRVVSILRGDELKVFFAPDCEEQYMGKDMLQAFRKIYKKECIFIVAFISEEYLSKEYTLVEADTAVYRSKEEKRDCIIPVYFGDIKYDRLKPSVNYIRADKLRETETASIISRIVTSYKEKNGLKQFG